MITNKTAFKEGRKAYEDGYAKSSNPYKKGDVKQHDDFRAHVSWNEGYDYAKKANIKESKFELYIEEIKNSVKVSDDWHNNYTIPKDLENKFSEELDKILKFQDNEEYHKVHKKTFITKWLKYRTSK